MNIDDNVAVFVEPKEILYIPKRTSSLLNILSIGSKNSRPNNIIKDRQIPNCENNLARLSRCPTKI
jgi:hypothetical protein